MLSAMGLSTSGGKLELLGRIEARLGVAGNVCKPRTQVRSLGGPRLRQQPFHRSVLSHLDWFLQAPARRAAQPAAEEAGEYVRDGKVYIPTEANGLMLEPEPEPEPEPEVRLTGRLGIVLQVVLLSSRIAVVFVVDDDDDDTKSSFVALSSAVVAVRCIHRAQASSDATPRARRQLEPEFEPEPPAEAVSDKELRKERQKRFRRRKEVEQQSRAFGYIQQQLRHLVDAPKQSEQPSAREVEMADRLAAVEAQLEHVLQHGSPRQPQPQGYAQLHASHAAVAGGGDPAVQALVPAPPPGPRQPPGAVELPDQIFVEAANVALQEATEVAHSWRRQQQMEAVLTSPATHRPENLILVSSRRLLFGVCAWA